jgi:hypothetical protein
MLWGTTPQEEARWLDGTSRVGLIRGTRHVARPKRSGGLSCLQAEPRPRRLVARVSIGTVRLSQWRKPPPPPLGASGMAVVTLGS